MCVCVHMRVCAHTPLLLSSPILMHALCEHVRVADKRPNLGCMCVRVCFPCAKFYQCVCVVSIVRKGGL